MCSQILAKMQKCWKKKVFLENTFQYIIIMWLQFFNSFNVESLDSMPG